MFKKDWRLFAQDILESIVRIESYVADLTYEDFLADNKTQDAVVRNLEIIGEDSASVSVSGGMVASQLYFREATQSPCK